MLDIPENTQIGAIKVVSKINNIEIPSIPNWKFYVVLSNEYQR